MELREKRGIIWNPGRREEVYGTQGEERRYMEPREKRGPYGTQEETLFFTPGHHDNLFHH